MTTDKLLEGGVRRKVLMNSVHTIDLDNPRIVRAARELYLWERSSPKTPMSNFTALLFDLISKADEDNLARLSLDFQEEVFVFKMWQKAASSGAFFKMMGIEGDSL